MSQRYFVLSQHDLLGPWTNKNKDRITCDNNKTPVALLLHLPHPLLSLSFQAKDQIDDFSSHLKGVDERGDSKLFIGGIFLLSSEHDTETTERYIVDFSCSYCYPHLFFKQVDPRFFYSSMKQSYTKQQQQQQYSLPARMNYNHNTHHSHTQQSLSPFVILYQRVCILYQRRRRLARWLVLLLLSVLFLLTRYVEMPVPFTRLSLPKTPPILHSFPPSPQTLEQLNVYLTPLSLEERLYYWIYEQPYKVISVTSFGATGMVLLDVISKMNLLALITVVTVDTLHLFPETYQFYETVQEHYPELDLRIYSPHISGKAIPTREAFDAHLGGADLYRTDPAKYAYHSKVEPLQRALKELKAQVWLTGRRRDQGDERSHLSFVEWETIQEDTEQLDEWNSSADRTQRLKVNLLVDYTYDQVWDYLRQNNVPYNPLHDRGYKSIGDTMTTRAVASTAAERSGRFVGLNQTECGMHHHLEKLQNMKQEALEQNVPFELPKIPCLECDYELTGGTFFDIVTAIPSVLLLEFYSPLCGACQDFAPTMEQVVHTVKHDDSLKERIHVARFDITIQPPTTAMEEAGFEVEVTPTLYLVVSSQGQQQRPILYTGELTLTEILKWIQIQVSE